MRSGAGLTKPDEINWDSQVYGLLEQFYQRYVGSTFSEALEEFNTWLALQRQHYENACIVLTSFVLHTNAIPLPGLIAPATMPFLTTPSRSWPSRSSP